MIDETDVTAEKQWYYEQQAAVVIKNLQKKQIKAQYVPDRQKALEAIMDMIPPGVVVARGDSLTCDQVGVIQEVRKRGQNAVIDPFERDSEGNFVPPPADRMRLQKEVFMADIMVAGTNAVTLDGKLVNIDGRGNRVAAMIFGPDKVIIAVGCNKIVRDQEEAIVRIRQYAAPLNVRRHVMKHHSDELADLPCARTGNCMDCNHDFRICRYTVIISGVMQPFKDRIHVVLIGEELGL
jgi:hypothetical protein